VSATLAVSRLIEETTGWSIKRFVRTAPSATARSTSAPAPNCSPPKTRSPTTYAKPAQKSTQLAGPH
jgi:hypothetical protein